MNNGWTFRLSLKTIGFLMRPHVVALVVPLLAGSCWSGVVFAQPAAPQLAPYRAIYEVDLSDEAQGSSKITAISALNGRMAYEFKGSACEGYATSQRLVTSTQMSEGATALEDVQMAAYEGVEGESYEFFKRRQVNQTPQQGQRGSAAKQGGMTRVEMSQPSSMAFELPENVTFPVAYQRGMLAAAEAGEPVFTANVFDGSDDPGQYFQVSTSIGTPFVGKEDSVPHPVLVGVKGWPVTISYYAASKNAEDMMPIYEINTEIYANGISGNMHFGFRDFTLDFSISELELIPVTPCE
ncbi:EipB family protein [uncultured Cohaesibacter sp.]|uniref:EipB family protein n=1 Tax=uncultured Cohaesibacter sp. TaxID=1002546 RepID=UPI0029C82A6C|nr:DUF1849 family protein [uncultured Cohaesibacter sp.]